MPQEVLKERFRTSLNRFFMCQREFEIASKKKMERKSLVFVKARRPNSFLVTMVCRQPDSPQ